MTDAPTIDDRTEAEVLADLRRRAANYTTDWDPYSEDPGTTLLMLFSRFGVDVIKRLNGVPHKHRVGFLNALDFDLRPPQSARVPLTFTTTADIDKNVVVPGGTQVTAESDEGDTVIFEIPGDDGFEATAATLECAYTVDPATNSIYHHESLIDELESTQLFAGQDLQKHEVYFGHADLLNLERGSTLTVPIQTPSGETIENRVSWEYYGENGDGRVDWHPLPYDIEEGIEDPFEDEVGLEEKMRRVSDQIQRFGETEEGEEELYEPSFSVPGTTVPTTVDGIDCRWIRGLIPGDEEDDFEVDIESARLDVEAGGDEMTALRPEMVFSNDVPISLEDENDIYPFGRMPHPPAMLYLSSEEAFTKKGGVVDVEFVPLEEEAEDETEDDDADEGDDDEARFPVSRGGPLSGPPEVSWEYWNGNGWTQLLPDADETDALRDGGTVSLTIPEDLEPTSVSGHDDYWIRARLVSGTYGQPEYRMSGEGAQGGELLQQTDPPLFKDITLRYGQRNASFEHVLTHNNVSFSTAKAPDEESLKPNEEEPLEPFESLADEEQTFYLGFDDVLMEGPVNLYVPMEDKAYPRGFEPGIRWEYCAEPETWSWKKLNVYDGTEGLTEPGIVSINFPERTMAFELFGERRHWIRARVTRDPFESSERAREEEADRPPEQEQTELSDTGTQGSKTPPTLEGVHPNTQWAYNERTVEENLGSSDGSPDQAFGCSNVPITEATVWVDELSNLSETEQRELQEDRPDDVRREGQKAANGTAAFWVRWEEVSDFLDSAGDARHYRLDRTNGTIRFGDGQTGAIPPSGEENIYVEYKTGGGSDGNVDAGAVTDIRSSISLIDSVTNLRQSDGGTDTESLEQAVVRAPKQIKNRGRAVSAEDFEEIAKDASRQLARVRCEPEMDEDGNRTPGWVTLLVIPRERRDRPTPSLELRQRVKDVVSDHAPATLVDHNDNRIVVRGPDYAEVSVETTVDTPGVESITNLKNTIEDTLDDFFHPLTGGRDGDGWEFGHAPRLSQLSTLIEETEDVERVRDITMTIETAQEEKIIRDPEKTPWLGRDEMISSGTHDVNVIMHGQR